jgi:tetratricopeptide (TPR) repeat protein
MYGHAQRQTFTCLGDAANLAARLMSAAPAGSIYVAGPVREAAGDNFTWEALPPITVKGKTDAIAVFALNGTKRRAGRLARNAESGLVGRQAEIAMLHAKLDEALHGSGRVVGVSGDAGVGKSRLIAEFTRGVRERGVLVASGECQSFGAHISYFAWRDVWATLFGIDRSASEDAQVQHVEQELAAVDPSLVARAPLLATLLDLPLVDNDLTSQFDPKLRKISLEGLLADALRARARKEPLVLVLEDCHWLDALSRDLLEVFARMVPNLPVLIAVAHRPAAQDDTLRLSALPNCDTLALGELVDDDAITLIRARLAPSGDATLDAPAALVELVRGRAQGNPFYIEELLNFIASRGVDPRDALALARLDLPESLHSLILSRVDRLAEAPRQILKVASVVGRVFQSPMLPGVYPEFGPLDTVEARLRELDAVDLVKMDESVARTYLFKHIVTRDVAYESLPFAFRSTLHERVGDYIEQIDEDAIDRNLDILAHHYWHSENRDKKREYLGRAGAAAQSAYANAAAIDYFERLAPLLSKGSRLDVLLKLGKVLELVGRWQRAEEIDREALELAESLDDGLRRASCQTALAEVVRKQGRFPEAFELLNRAARGFAAFGDDSGVARVLHLTGTVAAQRGDYDKAQSSYRKSLQIRERIGDKASMASLLSNLGVIAEYRGDYDGSRDFHERALSLRESVGDRWAIGISMTNLGMIAVLQKRFDEARDWFDKAMRINREVGDTWMVANCHNNLGNATRGLGDFAAARRHYAESLRIYREYDDRWALAFLLEDVGILAALTGDAVASLELIGAADAIREAIGAPRAPSLGEEIERQLGVAAQSLNVDARSEALARGRALDTHGAVDRALALCAPNQS